jgi:hypothetical protein
LDDLGLIGPPNIQGFEEVFRFEKAARKGLYTVFASSSNLIVAWLSKLVF